jgi:hypothetical protein
MQCAFFLLYGAVSGFAFKAVMERCEQQARADILIALPISALSHIKVGA